MNTIFGCRHCGDIYESSYGKELFGGKCPHCGLIQSKSYEEQIKNEHAQYAD